MQYQFKTRNTCIPNRFSFNQISVLAYGNIKFQLGGTENSILHYRLIRVIFKY